MKDLLSRFSFDTLKLNGQTWACAIVLWMVVLGCTLSSINSQPFNRQQRIFWIVVVLCFPLVGLFCYLPFCVLNATSDTSAGKKNK